MGTEKEDVVLYLEKLEITILASLLSGKEGGKKRLKQRQKDDHTLFLLSLE